MQPIVATFKTWQLHPFVDHFTVALILIGIAVDLIASLFATRLWLRYMALTLMILGAAGAWGSNVTGGWEAERVWEAVSGPGKDILKRHAELGDYLPWVFVALALWRIGVQFTGFIASSRPIYLAVAVLAGAAIIYQGRLGGELVYDYGIGTALLPVAAPVPERAAPAAAPSVEGPPPAPNAIPTVYVPPTASATPSAPTPSAEPSIKPTSAPMPTVAPPPPSPLTNPTPTPSASPSPVKSGTADL